MTKFGISLICLGIVLLIVAVFFLGCKDDNRFGTGDPPEAYQALFGNSNNARLDFIQTNRINQQIVDLKNLTERVDKIEKAMDPNGLSKTKIKTN